MINFQRFRFSFKFTVFSELSSPLGSNFVVQAAKNTDTNEAPKRRRRKKLKSLPMAQRARWRSVKVEILHDVWENVVEWRKCRDGKWYKEPGTDQMLICSEKRKSTLVGVRAAHLFRLKKTSCFWRSLLYFASLCALLPAAPSSHKTREISCASQRLIVKANCR